MYFTAYLSYLAMLFLVVIGKYIAYFLHYIICNICQKVFDYFAIISFYVLFLFNT